MKEEEHEIGNAREGKEEVPGSERQPPRPDGRSNIRGKTSTNGGRGTKHFISTPEGHHFPRWKEATMNAGTLSNYLNVCPTASITGQVHTVTEYRLELVVLENIDFRVEERNF